MLAQLQNLPPVQQVRTPFANIPNANHGAGSSPAPHRRPDSCSIVTISPAANAALLKPTGDVLTPKMQEMGEEDSSDGVNAGDIFLNNLSFSLLTVLSFFVTTLCLSFITIT